MLTRIVRMVFAPDFIPTFRELFESKSRDIRSYPGCTKLELWVDEAHANIFYTHSHWLSKDHLNNYRKSELFKSVWAETKKGFADRPQAWSTHAIMQISPKNAAE